MITSYTKEPILDLYVGSGRKLVRAGDSPFEGISLINNRIQQDSSFTGTHDILVHVIGTEASKLNTWVKFVHEVAEVAVTTTVTNDLVSISPSPNNSTNLNIGYKKGEECFWRNIVVCLGVLMIMF